MYDAICIHVARSHTSSAERPFSLIASLTLSNHILLAILSSFSIVHYFPSPCFTRSAPLFSAHYHTTSTSFPGRYLRFLPLSLCAPLFFHSFVTPHIHRSVRISATCNLFSCAFFNVHVSAPYAKHVPTCHN